MSIEEAIKELKRHISPYKNCKADANANEAIDTAIKSLEAWGKVENICTIQVADTFRNFKEYDRGSHAREKIRNTCREITMLLKEVNR